MRAILIDPEKQTVTEVTYNGDYREIHKLLGVSLFTCISLDNVNDLFIDDEGLLEDPEFFFEWEGYAQPLAGRGLILGHDKEGESIAPNLSLDEVKRKIKYSRYKVLGFEHFEGMTTHHGIEMPMVGHRPILQKRSD